jgi:hypothetical protein
VNQIVLDACVFSKYFLDEVDNQQARELIEQLVQHKNTNACT